MKNKYLVQYNTGSHVDLFIVIWAESRADVKPILKRHLGGAAFTIKKITQEEVKCGSTLENFLPSFS